MGIFSKFEGKMEDTFEGAAGKMQGAPISPVQIMKKAEKQMRREKMVSAGRQYAPTLYTVLVNASDDERLFGFYPTLAGECETRLAAQASADGLTMDGQPLVRFIVDEGLKRGKFDVIAEVVSAPIIAQLRAEEMRRYGMAAPQPQAAGRAGAYGQPAYAAQAAPQMAPQAAPVADPFAPRPYPAAAPQQQVAPWQPQDAAKPPLPYVPEEEIDRSVDYGEYTFDSKNFADYRAQDESKPAAHDAAPHVGMFADEEPLPGAAPAPLMQQPADGGEFAPAYENPAEKAVSLPPIERPVAPAQEAPEAPAAPQQPDAAAYAAQGQQFGAYPGAVASGIGAVSAGVAAAGAYPAGLGAYPAAAAPYGAQAAGFGADMGAYATPSAYSTPNTVAFTAGAGQVNPIPNQAAVRAHLIDLTSNRSYDLATNRILLGRETSNDIVINDLNASRQHAQIEFEPQGVWVITDLGSMNGTLVNGMPVQRRGLQDGDRIVLGVTEFVFSQR